MNKFVILIFIYSYFISIDCQQPLSSFYPFGAGSNDKTFPNSDDFTLKISLSKNFKFFQSTYNAVYLCTNGHISFDTSIASSENPVMFPDLKLTGLAPLWYDIDTRRHGNIYYRETTSTADLSKITLDVKKAYPNLASDINWAFIVTWFEVLSYDNLYYNSTDYYSTFQATLASNTQQTFFIYKYNQIDKFQGFQYNYKRYDPQVGFNDVASRSFLQFPGALTPSIKTTLTSMSNAGSPGLWVLTENMNSITLTTPQPISTTTPTIITTTTTTTTAQPIINPPTMITDYLSGSYLGRYNIRISGTRFLSSDLIQIKYEKEATLLGCKFVSTTEAACPVPFLNLNFGAVNLEVMRNGLLAAYGSFRTLFSGIDVVADIDTGAEIFYGTNSMIFLAWNQRYVKSKLVAVGFFRDSAGIMQSWSKILNPDTSLSQSLSVRIDNVLPDGTNSHGFAFYILDANDYLMAVSKNLFYFGSHAYVSGNCHDWHQLEGDISGMRNEISSTYACPSFVSVPMFSAWPISIDNGRFEIDDRCRVGAMCPFNFGAEICYKSTEDTVNGYGNLCCYNRNGNLNVGILNGSGAMRKYHPVSSLSYWNHMHHDILPYLWCCENGNYCNLYEEKRPSY